MSTTDVDSPLEQSTQNFQRRSRWLARLVRRWFVPREEHDDLRAALKLAYGHIIRHHEAGIEQHAGCFCQVCHHKDGSEPEMDVIHRALYSANAKGDAPGAIEKP